MRRRWQWISHVLKREKGPVVEKKAAQKQHDFRQ